ncbi:MAG: hypothetical protein SFX18_18455 [Pirellulales bacterium]|nr:hypothetical protein [Pirellulales bacterium]
MPRSPFVRYRNLPELAGLCSMADAQAPGLAVGECVDRLKRFHYVWKRLHGIWTARITAEPIYELKSAFSHHAYLAAEHAMALRKRVGEMREPPLGLEETPHPGLQYACDEVLATPDTPALLLGIYDVLLPALCQACERYQRETHPLADAPSRRILKFAILELREILDFGTAAMAGLVTAAEKAEYAEWLAELRQALAAAGEVDGAAKPAEDAAIQLPPPRYTAQPYQYDRVPRRDARFQDGYNAGVNPEAFLYDERYRPRDKTLMMYYKRLREIDVPEMMASIIVETTDKPWGYYLDMTRQLWDEARHAMLGEVGFIAQGVDWTKIPINFTWSLNLNTQLTPAERHAVLYFIEQGLMPRSGKRFEWEVGTASGDELSKTFQDFDWADEVLHARIGRDWYVKDFADPKTALDYGDKCWSKVVSHWRSYLERGLTQHRNWWPEIYLQACQVWGVAPDPAALAFATTYEHQRADLKLLSSSG